MFECPKNQSKDHFEAFPSLHIAYPLKLTVQESTRIILLKIKDAIKVTFCVYYFCVLSSFRILCKHNHIHRIYMVFHQCVFVNVFVVLLYREISYRRIRIHDADLHISYAISYVHSSSFCS